MPRRCEISGKTAQRGKKVSHANNRSNKTWQVNLHFKRLFDQESGKWIRIKVSSRGLRTIAKNGISESLKGLSR